VASNHLGKKSLTVAAPHNGPIRDERFALVARVRRGTPFTPFPGMAICIAVSFGAYVLERAQSYFFHRVWLETLVLAIVIGMTIRSCWTPGAKWQRGIDFSAKMLLEIAVVLLGASLSAKTLVSAGLPLLLSIAAVVMLAIAVSYGISRALGLHSRLAILIACGNAICGNSAIAAVAPVIKAEGDDIAASIAFTAVLGVIVVLMLPLLIPLCNLTAVQYGALAGLTVYAVPQVLAATAPISLVSVNIGTLVKLVRVLMLGPVIFVLSVILRANIRRPAEAPIASCDNVKTPDAAPTTGLASPGIGAEVSNASASSRSFRTLALYKLVPWFIIGFLLMMVARSFDAIPAVWLPPLHATTSALTVISMAALGLGVDIRSVAQAGIRVSAAVVLSILALTGISLTVIFVLNAHALLG
jgi:uncharacterized integral membrane protein (TIGR00698 family)